MCKFLALRNYAVTQMSARGLEPVTWLCCHESSALPLGHRTTLYAVYSSLNWNLALGALPSARDLATTYASFHFTLFQWYVAASVYITRSTPPVRYSARSKMQALQRLRSTVLKALTLEAHIQIACVYCILCTEPCACPHWGVCMEFSACQNRKSTGAL